MDRLYKILSVTFAIGLLGGIVMTFITPSMISILFTPPVSFGTNCEPAAAWSMNKLVFSQLFGVIVGMLVGLGGYIWLSQRQARVKQVTPPVV